MSVGISSSIFYPGFHLFSEPKCSIRAICPITRYFADKNISSFFNLKENQWFAHGIKCAYTNLCSELLSHEGLFQNMKRETWVVKWRKLRKAFPGLKMWKFILNRTCSAILNSKTDEFMKRHLVFLFSYSSN
jgi:hypothetical protein